MADKLPERPQIDLDHEAVQRAQARREALAARSGGRNVLIGIGGALAGLFVLGVLFHRPPEPAPMPASTSAGSPSPSRAGSASSPASSSPSSPSIYSSSPATGGHDVPYVDPRSGPQSGYDLAPEEIAKSAQLPNATVLTDPSSHVIAERLFVRNGIRLIRVTEPSRYELVGCDPVPDDEAARYAALVETELALYPQRFISAAGVAFVALCHDVVDLQRRRSSVGLPGPGVVMLDTSEFRDESYFRATFHRALYRVIDGREGHGVDAEWTGLNAPGFAYATSNRFGDPVSSIGSGGAGFVTDTARESTESDKAETFRALLLDNRAAEQLAASDPVVERKVALIKRRLLARSNAMDSAFWSATH